MEQNNQNDEIEINLKELFVLLLGGFWLLLMAGLSFASVAFLLSEYVIPPIYQSTTKIYIMNKENAKSAITFMDLQSGTQLTKDYMTMVTSRSVTEQVIAQLGLDMNSDELADLVTVDNPENTRILSITVNYDDPYMAKRIADSLREISAAHIINVMNIERVNVVEEGNIPEQPTSPNITRNVVIGGAVGVFLTALIIILVHILNDTIKNPDDVEKYLGLSVLSSIPMQKDRKESGSRKRKKKVEKKKKTEKKTET
jgi:capsular polysaccharide biosynthesis protein